MRIQDLSLEKIRESPTLSDENWVKINKPDVYQKIIKLTSHMDCDFISRVEYIHKLIVENKLCLLYFK
jgi:hypothetical protein